MGMLDGILGGIVGGGVTRLVGSLIEQHGGVAGLVSQFQQKGLGDMVKSWVSTGPNQSISPQQVEHVLGSDMVAQLAAKFGLEPAALVQQLSQHLPQAVDRLTPGGALPG